MTHDAHIDAVYVDKNVALLEILAARPVQYRLHLLTVGAIGYCETKTHCPFGDLHSQKFQFEWRRQSTIHSTANASIAIFVACSTKINEQGKGG